MGVVSPMPASVLVGVLTDGVEDVPGGDTGIWVLGQRGDHGGHAGLPGVGEAVRKFQLRPVHLVAVRGRW